MAEETKEAPQAAPKETASAPANPPAGGSGKKSNTSVIVIVVVVVAVLAVLGFVGNWVMGRVTKKVGETAAEKLIGAATGSDVDVSDNGVSVKSTAGSFSASESKTWPSDMPTAIPKLSGGEIDTVSTLNISGNKSWTVAYNSVKEADFTDYTGSLKSAGWTESLSSSSGGESLGMYTKDKYSINVTFNSTESTATLTVTENNEATPTT
jgi:hypothetical protein